MKALFLLFIHSVIFYNIYCCVHEWVWRNLSNLHFTNSKTFDLFYILRSYWSFNVFGFSLIILSVGGGHVDI